MPIRVYAFFSVQKSRVWDVGFSWASDPCGQPVYVRGPDFWAMGCHQMLSRYPIERVGSYPRAQLESLAVLLDQLKIRNADLVDFSTAGHSCTGTEQEAHALTAYSK